MAAGSSYSSDPIYLASVYRLTAVNFWKSAKVVSSTFTDEGDHRRVTAVPFYFLVSHAAELMLKSALLKRGLCERDLKEFDARHDLKSLLEKLLGKGVHVTQDTIKLIGGLHSQHLDHALRYTALCDNGKKTYMPPPSLAFSMLEDSF